MYQFSDFQECKVDAKGRLMFPAVYRKGMGDALAEGFVLKRSINSKSLQLFTKASWDIEKQKISKLNKYKEAHRNVIRHLMDGVITDIELDSSGRLLLPKDLLKYAEIENDVTLSPAFDYLEIWNTNNYRSALEETLPNISDLVEEALGGTSENE